MNRTRILVADDSELIQDLLCDVFEAKGYEVVKACDGKEAIKLFDSDRPDVVLLDIMMPNLNGIEVLQHIKKTLPGTLVVMMTAHGSEKTAVEAMKEGADDYITKPLSYKKVVNLIEELLEKNRVRLENVKLKEKIEKTERYLAHLIDHVNEAIISTDEKGNILSFNSAAERLWQADEKMMLEKPLASLIKNENKNGCVDKVIDMVERDGRYGGEFIFTRSDKSDFPGYLSTSMMCDVDGNKEGMVAVIRDLTSEKMLRDQLIESAKLASLGKVVEGIAHEVRNPLISMGGIARRMEHKFDEKSDYKKYLQVIIEDVNRLEKMVKDIEEYVDFAKEHKFNFKHVNLRNIIDETISKFDFKRLNIETDISTSEMPNILGDEDGLKEVFYNLFENAADAMREGGNLSVGFKMEENFLRIDVKDTGCGIPKELHEDIYDPFYTSKMSGIGIGLSKVYLIIEEQHGFIDVESEEGSGTTFTLKLPVEKRQPART